jgi:hypothetical protein
LIHTCKGAQTMFKRDHFDYFMILGAVVVTLALAAAVL